MGTTLTPPGLMLAIPQLFEFFQGFADRATVGGKTCCQIPLGGQAFPWPVLAAENFIAQNSADFLGPGLAMDSVSG